MRALVIIFCVSCAFLFSLNHAANAGEATRVMEKHFCAPLFGNDEPVNKCVSSWNHRINYGKSREDAFSSCKNACDNKYGAGTGTGGVCQRYCQNTWERDN